MKNVLTETLRRRRKDETFERTLGKVVRTRKLPFDFYMDVIDAVRKNMKKGETLDKAAEILCSQKTQK
jgi:hypothetical protein